jgi:hypothetical protein
VEGDGFELSVPRVMGGRFRTTVPAAIAVASCCVQLPKKTYEDPVASDRDVRLTTPPRYRFCGAWLSEQAVKAGRLFALWRR